MRRQAKAAMMQRLDALVAQGIEQPPPKRQATRSNRVEGTIFGELIIWKSN